jgi:hypothetical protein
MNEKNHRDENDVERLIRAGFDNAARPGPAAREQAWNRVKAAWQAEQGAAARTASANSATPGNGNEQSESQNNIKHERNTLMNLFSRNRWGFGLGATAGAAAVIMIIALTTPKAHATAAQIMAKGAQAVAKLTSIHLRGQLRTLPADNFSYINADQDFYPIELWKQLEPDLKWKVEKPGRVAVMDGHSTLLYIKSGKMAVKLDKPSTSAFDTDWLHRIANLSHTISNELRNAQANGWKLELAEETAADGSVKAVVTVHAKSGVPDDDYTKNSFLENADTRRVYRFDTKTELLEGVRIYLVKAGAEVPIFELNQIDYNQPLGTNIWQVDLPADVGWYQEPQKLPDNDRYASMTPEQAARAFFEACGREDWAEVGKFYSPVTDQIKEYLGGLQIVSLGTPFTSQTYPGRFVPYEIKLPGQTFNIGVANTNAAKRFVLTGVYDAKLRLQQSLMGAGEPEVLTNNDAYAKLSPTEAVQAYFDAQAKLDWVEMRKFTSQSDVDDTKRQVQAAEKSGMDPHKAMPVLQAGEAVWSPEQSVYFVKSRMSGGVKKHNLAVRNDNPAGRWQVDGGF